MSDEISSREFAENFARRFAPPELYDPAKRREWKLGRNENDRGPYIVELNLQHVEGLSGAVALLVRLASRISSNPENAVVPDRISRTYMRCWMSLREWQLLLRYDEQEAIQQVRADWKRAAEQRAQKQSAMRTVAKRTKPTPPLSGELASAESLPSVLETMRYRAIYKLWPDFPVYAQISKSIATIKSDAAFNSFNATGTGIVWAVIDSGIDGQHPHFQQPSGHSLLSPAVKDLHRCFVDSESIIPGTDIQFVAKAPALPEFATTTPDERRRLLDQHVSLALTDDLGHGTHVAGIIAGRGHSECTSRLLERVDVVNANGELQRGQFQETATLSADALRGVAPECRLVSLRVLDGRGEGRSSDVIRALEYVRENLNDNPKLMRVHGVNLSVGYEFDPEMFACGQSPVCAEVNRLVQSGVVVVAAAGNTGFGTVAASVRATKVGLSNTINDPGNAEFAITVGATHRDSPHTYGVSYFSSKGPTGDGRMKPDLLAPGERITSCGAGKRLRDARANAESSSHTPTAADATNRGDAYYMEDSGTSMAAPHVSGAVAAFLSIRREFIGKPLDVKEIFLKTATPLGRERYFEGHGLIDLMRAIQSV